jgi:hypothetical protein
MQGGWVEPLRASSGLDITKITLDSQSYLLGFTAVLSTPTQAKPTPQDQNSMTAAIHEPSRLLD